MRIAGGEAEDHEGENEMEELRYPIGQFIFPQSADAQDQSRWLDEIAACPDGMRVAIKGLDDAQLDTPYRPQGWTVRQVVHHVADSHMNSYIRFKLALTEDRPTIRGYDEGAWAQLQEARGGDPEVSLALLESLHRRWVLSLRAIDDDGWNRTFVHPEIGEVRLIGNLAYYAWHGKHHIAHIAQLREREGWSSEPS